MTVLNVVEAGGNVWTYLVLFFLGVAIILIGICLVSDYSGTTSNVTGVGCITIGAVLAFVSIVLLTTNTSTTHKEYEVIIDEKTTFHEIYDKYDVVKQEGYIYTLVDKEKENEQ